MHVDLNLSAFGRCVARVDYHTRQNQWLSLILLIPLSKTLPTQLITITMKHDNHSSFINILIKPILLDTTNIILAG